MLNFFITSLLPTKYQVMIVGITSHAQNASPSGQNRSDLDPQRPTPK